MTIIQDKEFADFLSKRPLYTKIKAAENIENADFNYSNPLDFENKPFKFNCPQENEIQTFKTSVFGGRNMMYGRPDFTHYSAEDLPLHFDHISEKLNKTIHLIGTCQSCGAHIDFLIKAFTDKSWENRNEGITIFLQKIGQFPAYEIEPENVVKNYLTEEDLLYYKKALINLSVSFGIGAFAYFRRIIENEVKRIIKDLSEMDFDGSNKISEAYIDFEVDHQMSKLITSINSYLPTSLNDLGDNPFKLLYEQLSGGIHSYPEEVCLEKAQHINILLTFVIQKVSEEKVQRKKVQDAMRKLRNT